MKGRHGSSGMLEVPRGSLTADEIAWTAEFFSSGTNDLTQTCLGMSARGPRSRPGAWPGRTSGTPFV